MDTGQLWNLLALNNLPLLLSAAALLFALIAIMLILGARRRHQEQVTTLRERADWLCREVDDIRVVHFSRTAESGTAPKDRLHWTRSVIGLKKKPMTRSGLRCGTCTTAWACS